MAAAAVLCGNKRSLIVEEDVEFPSPLYRSKRLRCSSYSVPPQPVYQLRRPAEENEAQLTNENLNSNRWVELFVREMSSATSVDDAKARTAKALEVFEQLIRSRASTEAEVAAAQKEEENMVLKQEIEEKKKENMILQRGVFIQNERLKEFAGRNQELEHVKQLVNQYKEQLAKLEVDNYGLELHLKQAQCSSSMPLSFYPHVF